MKNEFIKRILSSLFLIPIVFFLIIKGSYFFYTLLILCLLVCFYEWHFMTKNKPYYSFGFIFLLFSFYSIFQLRVSSEINLSDFFLILIICILTDIGGFVFGRVFKGPKLTKFSPNKTYSGVVGSYLLSFTIIPFFIFYNLINEENLFEIVFLIFFISSVSQIGDIMISYFKRIAKIKDTGKLIPGHGGLLDRVDGMIFAFPSAYLIMLTNLSDII